MKRAQVALVPRPTRLFPFVFGALGLKPQKLHVASLLIAYQKCDLKAPDPINTLG